MVWCSGWKLACAVSNAGALGLIGGGSMDPVILKEHITKTRSHTAKPFGVNLPMLGRDIEAKVEVILRENVPVVFTSAGDPTAWVPEFKKEGIKVAHVVPGTKNALKAIDAGADAIVAEGFEAGGHNGRDETTTMVLLPLIRSVTSLPLIAAGGMYSGRSLLAAMALGADAIQVGSRFAISAESSAHENYKNIVTKIKEGDTRLILKKLVPVRLIRNKFADRIIEADEKGASRTVLKEILGSGREKLGIFEGDLEEGELEIGQVSAILDKIESAADIVNDIVNEYISVKKQIAPQE